jgi:hypothetical protein
VSRFVIVRQKLFWLLLPIVGLLAIWPAKVRAEIILLEDFTLFATHPDAQLQATERGRTIRDVTFFNGQLYTGYGDWAYDDGPIQIRSLDAVTGAWSDSLLSFGSEAISHFRKFGNQLLATSTDPEGLGLQPGGFALGSSGHQWAQQEVVLATHVLDVNRTSNGDLWLVGSQGQYGTIWRSTDGGASFNIARQDLPPASATDYAFSRYVGAGVLGSSLYVQRADFNYSEPNTESFVFDGAEWSIGPNLISQGSGYLSKPERFGSNLVYMDNDLSFGYLYRFDGTASQLALPGIVHDFQVTDSQVIVLAQGGELLFSSDLNIWESAGLAPIDARSIELVGNQLFVGTTNSRILSTFNLGGISVVPEPGSGGCVLWSLLLLVQTRTARKPIMG